MASGPQPVECRNRWAIRTNRSRGTCTQGNVNIRKRPRRGSCARGFDRAVRLPFAVIGNTGGQQGLALPAIIAEAAKGARSRFLEFFTVNIRNPNTHAAYSFATAASRNRCKLVQHVPSPRARAPDRRAGQASLFRQSIGS